MAQGENNEPNEKMPDVGVSQFALSVARVLDRLPEGEFELRLSKIGKRPRLVVVTRLEHVRNIFELPGGRVGESEPPGAPA